MMIWPFSIWTKARKSDDEFDASRVAEARRIILLMQGKWQKASMHPPPTDKEVRFTFDGEMTFTLKWDELSPTCPTNNLWWRPLE